MYFGSHAALYRALRLQIQGYIVIWWNKWNRGRFLRRGKGLRRSTCAVFGGTQVERKWNSRLSVPSAFRLRDSCFHGSGTRKSEAWQGFSGFCSTWDTFCGYKRRSGVARQQICLRQIAFVPNAGRHIAVPTGCRRADVGIGPYGVCVCSSSAAQPSVTSRQVASKLPVYQGSATSSPGRSV